jgi:hypothetical protein
VAGFAATLMALTMIAAFLLVAGGLYLMIKRRDGRKGLLMLGAAAVLIANVVIWTA